MSDSGIVQQAMLYALDAHRNQKRKYTGEPYSVHLAEVVGYVASIPWIEPRAFAVAWLHDVCEDCGVTLDVLGEEFGAYIAWCVAVLTDKPSTWGNRKARKHEQRERLARAPGAIQSIKCADIISNTQSIALHDPKFAPVYIDECVTLLSVLQAADPQLRMLAAATLQRAAVQYGLPLNAVDGPRHG